jgi:hypothetical protein
MNTIRVSSVGMALTLAFMGCGGNAGGPPEFAERLVPVSGTVTLNGQPLSGATVQFLLPRQATSGEMAEGVTDSSGKYELQTHMAQATAAERRGALPGEYIVVVSKIEMPDGSPLPPGTTEADAEAEGAKQVVPARYTNEEATPLRATVNQEPTVIDLEL